MSESGFFPYPNISPGGDEANSYRIAISTSQMLPGSWVYRDHVDERHYFLMRFGKIPNTVMIKFMNGRKVIEWLMKSFGTELKDLVFVQASPRTHWKVEQCEVLVQFYEDLVISVVHKINSVHICYRETDPKKVEEVISSISKFKIRVNKESRIQVLVERGRGLEIDTLKLKKQTLSIDQHYNDDFLPLHDLFVHSLKKRDAGGLILLHGKPGTGKTTYIRHLAHTLNKHFIFIPPTLVSKLATPAMLDILIDNKGSVLVIEDAEQAIHKRSGSGDSGVSSLLNITDGLLADFLGIKVICTFNTDIAKIDDALLRKGRLIGRYEFGELVAEKADRILASINPSAIGGRPMVLADIFNHASPDFHTIKKGGIGFRRVKTPQPVFAEEFPY